MKKIMYLTIALLLYPSLNLYADLINPYNGYNLQNTQKIMISFFETRERKIHENKRIEINDIDIPKILNELNKIIEYRPGITCDCFGDGKIFFLLKDKTEVEFRIKHGAAILEYNYGKFDNQFLEMTDGFKQIIGQYCPKDLLTTYEKKEIDTIYIPKDLDECFVELNKVLTPEQLAEFKSKKEKEIAEYHFSIGRWMRNSWQLWGESRLKNYFNELGIYHPDDMSGIILTSFHRHLHNNDIKLEEQIKQYQEYWNKVYEKEFYEYYSGLLEYRKRPEVMVSSRNSDHNDCEAYRSIVEKGKVFIPFIIEKIKKGDFFLNQAMQEITGFDIKTTSEAKEVIGEQDISKLWIEWWKKKESNINIKTN